jgi:hypothetical protein
MPDARLAVAAATLRVDAVTAEVLAALAESGVRAILLKGPSVSRWLYEEGERAYVDTDLLVAPGEHARAERVLTELGFEKLIEESALPGPVAAMSWRRGGDPAVDLHRTLVGVGEEPETVWGALAARTKMLRVGAIDALVLASPAREVHVALHAAQHGARERQPVEDLRRALGSVGEKTWREAATVAQELGAVPAFASGLRLLPEGTALAERLALPTKRSVEASLRARTAPMGSRAFDRIAAARGFRARLAQGWHSLAPSPAHMRAFVPLARRGRIGLASAYAVRLFAVARALPRALAAWARARAEQRR